MNVKSSPWEQSQVHIEGYRLSARYWTETNFYAGRDVNFNTFNIDMFYTWDFLPGSRLTLSWKNALGGDVYLDETQYRTYFKNFNQVLRSPHSNELSLKVVYYLDYLTLRKH